MTTVTRTIFVKVLTFDPAQGKLVPVPGARLLCEDSGWLWDPDLSDGSHTTNGDGLAEVAISFDDTAEQALNPFFTITLPADRRAVPATAPAERQVRLPEEWVTRHYVNKRIPRITDHADPNRPLELLVGLHADLRLAYSDYDRSGTRNPFALPENTVRVYLADYDEFFWIDVLNPDDTLGGFAFDPREGKTVAVGDEERYPYFDSWPTAPSVFDEGATGPRAWLDPPGAPVGSLGGGSFAQVGALAADGHGFVFMLDGNVVRRFYPDGTLCETIDPSTGGFGLSGPKGLALDQYRHLFIADTGNNRLVIMEPDHAEGGSGRYVVVRTVGGPGSADGQFDGPRGLAVVPNPVVDGPELLAVADTGNQRVQLFTIALNGEPFFANRCAAALRPDLTFASAAGTPGSGPGQLNEPVAVACDGARRLYVCDRALHRVSRWRLDESGPAPAYVHEADWEQAGGGASAGDGAFNTPEAVAVDIKHEHVYVAESGNKRVQRLDTSGAHLCHWSHGTDAALGAPFNPAAVAVDARSAVYVADGGDPRVLRARVYRANGVPQPDGERPALVGGPWTPAGSSEHMRGPGYVLFGPDGRLYVSDTGNNRVLVFARDAEGALVAAPAPPAAGLSAPAGLALDPEGNLFVVDAGNGRVRRYSPALAHASDLGAPGTGPGQLAGPRGLAIAQRVEPILYVADTGNSRVQRFRRDGTALDPLTEGAGVPFRQPEDVAIDAAGNSYIADTGNGRVVQLNSADAFVRAFNVPAGVAGPAEPCGISVDDEGKLIVTDRHNNRVLRFEADGTLLASWDLQRLVAQDVAAHEVYYPDLARLLVFDRPARAAIDGRGLLAVADTGHDRVRLVRTWTSLQLNLIDLGEGLPDISLRAVTKADWEDELGLELDVGDVSIFDESHDLETEPVEDFARDSYTHRQLLGAARSTSGAVNVMRVVRQVQRWYQHNTRFDEAAGRWGVKEHSRSLGVDLIDSEGSYQVLDVNLGEGSPHGHGSDAWDDALIAHEMTHWVFFKALAPYLPFTPVGFIGLMEAHTKSKLGSFNQTLTEGWANYVEHFWGSEFSSVDRIRGFGMSTGRGLFSLRPPGAQSIWRHLFGGPRIVRSGGNVVYNHPTQEPDFQDPGQGLRNEGFFANALYQLHLALGDPGIRFADAPSYWHRFNAELDEDESRRYADTIWRGLRSFPADPPLDELDQGSRIYLRGVLAQAHARQPAFAQLVQSIFELNNLLMPTITIALQSAPDQSLSGPAEVRELEPLALVVRVRDATGTPLRGYSLRFDVGERASYTLPAGPGPEVRHGRNGPPGPDVFYRATTVEGRVNLTFTPPPGSAGRAEALAVSYQPDFDTDTSFDPPAKADDEATAMRKLYLHELRTTAKTWPGAGNNFGAIVSTSLSISIKPA